MAIYFISDFHLGAFPREEEDAKYRRFEKFLAEIGDDLEHLIILGDMFDFWFEYKHLIPKHHLQFLFKLRELVDRGATVSYVCGNHDFWMGDFMESELGIKMFRDEMVIPTPQGTLYATHGDGIAPSDWKYRILKRILRNKVNIALYRLLPPGLAYRLAHKVAHQSREHTSARPKDDFIEEYVTYACKKLAEGHLAFICGHIHFPEIRDIDGKYYINTGDWIEHFSWVKFDTGIFTSGSANS